jgi:molybdopterin synthase sulfur carrier subunit
MNTDSATTTINVSGFLTDFTAGRSVIVLETSPATVGAALAQLWEMYPGLRDRIVNERGEVRMHVNVFLKDENIRHKKLLETQLPENSEITILPSVSGGLSTDYTDDTDYTGEHL